MHKGPCGKGLCVRSPDADRVLDEVNNSRGAALNEAPQLYQQTQSSGMPDSHMSQQSQAGYGNIGDRNYQVIELLLSQTISSHQEELAHQQQEQQEQAQLAHQQRQQQQQQQQHHQLQLADSLQKVINLLPEPSGMAYPSDMLEDLTMLPDDTSMRHRSGSMDQPSSVPSSGGSTPIHQSSGSYSEDASTLDSVTTQSLVAVMAKASPTELRPLAERLCECMCEMEKEEGPQLLLVNLAERVAHYIHDQFGISDNESISSFLGADNEDERRRKVSRGQDWKGDLGYFFNRNPHMSHLVSGSVVALRNGELHEPQAVDVESEDAGLFLVISDDFVLFKGGQQPAPSEEHMGHHVAWVGQVPTRVRGHVQPGDWIGAAVNGGHTAEVVPKGSPRAVGVAIEAKAGEQEGLVLTALAFQQCTIGQATAALKGNLADITQRLTQMEEKQARMESGLEIVEEKHDVLAAQFENAVKGMHDDHTRMDLKTQELEHKVTQQRVETSEKMERQAKIHADIAKVHLQAAEEFRTNPAMDASPAFDTAGIQSIQSTRLKRMGILCFYTTPVPQGPRVVDSVQQRLFPRCETDSQGDPSQYSVQLGLVMALEDFARKLEAAKAENVHVIHFAGYDDTYFEHIWLSGPGIASSPAWPVAHPKIPMKTFVNALATEMQSSTPLRCIVLNAANSLSTARAVLHSCRGTETDVSILCWSTAVTEQQCVRFKEEFYRCLASRPGEYEYAYRQACSFTPNLGEDGREIPCLLSHSKCLVLLEETPVELLLAQEKELSPRSPNSAAAVPDVLPKQLPVPRVQDMSPERIRVHALRLMAAEQEKSGKFADDYIRSPLLRTFQHASQMWNAHENISSLILSPTFTTINTEKSWAVEENYFTGLWRVLDSNYARVGWGTQQQVQDALKMVVSTQAWSDHDELERDRLGEQSTQQSQADALRVQACASQDSEDLFKSALQCYSQDIATLEAQGDTAGQELALALYGKGVVLRKLDHDEEAVRCFERAVRIDPSGRGTRDAQEDSKGAMWDHLGDSLVKLGRFQEGLVAYKTACKVNPSQRLYARRLIEAEELRKQAEEWQEQSKTKSVSSDDSWILTQ